MLRFVIQCLPATLSVITTDLAYDRISLLKNLFLNKEGKTYVNILAILVACNSKIFPPSSNAIN